VIGSVLLVLSLGFAGASWAVVRWFGPGPSTDKRSWDDTRKRVFLLCFPIALLIDAAVFFLYFSGATGFITR
jgi:hypothetical protein